MDFGKILDQWEKQSPGIYDKVAVSSSIGDYPAYNESPASRRRRLLRKSPDASIDLHGLTKDEAWNSLSVFFNDAKNKALEKVLIIHGKGNHEGTSGSRETGILRKMVRDFIERCPFAGESGYSNARSGGMGSTWVLLKKVSVPGR
ncbi:MAG: Smr/MutS family protein [Treponema sp.]|jgi:DNA-nicking Smr family endonuclease|nr:Smr/MutS family protein [Treponema sp.]